MLHERVRRAFLDIAEEEPDRCVVVDASQPEAMVAEDVWEVGPPALEPMSMAAERARAAALAEPDRLEGFSAPREVDRLFGHDGGAAPSSPTRSRSGRMHHAWLIVGPEGIGKATLAYRFARIGAAEGERARTRSIASTPVFRKVAALSHPNLLVIRRAWNEKTKRYAPMDRRRRGQAPARLSRHIRRAREAGAWSSSIAPTS